ncbi:dynactin subunit 4-like isoform X1 [Oculina patagonica]
MASTFEGDGVRVLLTCSCSALSPAARLYFCRHCIKLRCPLCVSHEVDSYYCPNCLENMPSAEAKVKKNRCANCFDCPSCGNTLSTRATAVAIQSDKGGDDSKATQAKKVYYLACGFCRWSSRDIGIEDKSVASGAWQEQESPAAKRVNTLVEYYRQLAQKEKVEREKKKLTKRRNYMHLSFTPRKDKFGLSSLTRRKSSLSYLTANYNTKGKEIADDVFSLKNPSEAVEEVETLPEEFYNKPLILEKVPHLTQRLCQPDFQPGAIGDLHPRHKHLLAKRSQRCRQCEHNLSKPEFNPSSIKFKIQLGAVHYVPMLRISNVSVLKFGKEAQVTLSLTNPVENLLKVTLLKIDQDEKDTAKENDAQDKENKKDQNADKKDEEKEKESKKENEEEKDKDKDEKKEEQEQKEKSEAEQEKAAEKDNKKDGSHVGVPVSKKPDRSMDNSCESRSFVSTAEVILPTFPLMLGARDEAAEFDEMDSGTPAEMFNDDPRVVVNRQANKLWFLVKVVPQKTLGDVKFSMIMQYDYKHIATALVRGGQESEEQIVTLKHKLHINLGPVDSES